MHKVAPSLRSRQRDGWQRLLEHGHNFCHDTLELSQAGTGPKPHTVCPEYQSGEDYTAVVANIAFKGLHSYRIYFQRGVGGDLNSRGRCIKLEERKLNSLGC